MAKLGIPIGGRIFFERAAVAYATILAGLQGKDALASQEIALQHKMFVIVPFYGVGRGMGILIRRYRDNLASVNRLSLAGHISATAFSIFALLVYNLFADTLIGIFLQDVGGDQAYILETTRLLFLINGIAEIFDCNRSVLEGSFRGIEKTFYTMLANIGTIWLIGAPISYLLGFQTELTLSGIFIGRAIGVALGTGLLLYKWLKETSSNESSIEEVIDREKVSATSLNTRAAFFGGKGESNIQQEEDDFLEDKPSKQCCVIL